jgi:hypothetical protein
MTAAAVEFADFGSIETAIESLRAGVLFSEQIEGLTPLAEQHVHLAIAALESARRHMAIAGYHEARDSIRRKLAERREQRPRAAALPAPRFDETFHRGLAELEAADATACPFCGYVGPFDQEPGCWPHCPRCKGT